MARSLMMQTVLLIFLLGSQQISFISNSRSESNNLKEEFSSIQSTSFSNGISYVDYDMLSLVLGGDAFMNINNFTSLIVKYFIPENIRTIGLSVGWEEHANTTHSDISFYKWVDDFLAATDYYDIDILFIFDPWKKLGEGSSWWNDVIKDKPELESLLMNYTLHSTNEQALLVADSPVILEQFKEDLKQLYDYYGKHSSWKGILFGRPSEAIAIIPVKDFAINLAYNNYTLNKFLNSVFYTRDMNENGIHIDGTVCKIWQQFRSSEPIILYFSGYAQRSYPENLGGECSLAIIFKATKTIEGFKVSWYGRRVGTPSNLRLELYDVEASNISLSTSPLEVITVSSELIKTEVGWQPFVEFKSTLCEGATYSIVFKAEGGEGSDKYVVYYRNYRVDDSIFMTSATGGKWIFKGSAIFWIKDREGKDFLIYPFQDRGIIRNDKSGVSQVFKSPGNFTFNTVFLSVSDRHYDENMAIVKVVRNLDGKVIARGAIRPNYTRGMYWWIPVPLESEATLKEGEYYTLNIERMSAGEGWQLHYLVTNPAVAGPQGNDKMLLFKLAYMDPIFINFMKIGPPGRAGPEAGWPGAEYRTWWAQRYKISRNASILRVEINIEKYGNPGDLIVRLREDDGTGQAPSGEDLETIRIPATNISAGRVWLNITGWGTMLNAGKMYWITLSTEEAPEGNGYWPWKIEYAYQFLIKRSDDAGATWVKPHEPAELHINLFTSEESFIVEPEAIVRQTFITEKKQVAQSFLLEEDTYVHGLLIFLSRSPGDQDGLLVAEVRADSGFDSPSTMVLTSGRIRMIESGITFKGMQLIEFEYPYYLKAGVRYWIVIKGDESSRIEPVVFTFCHPEFSYGGINLKAKITNDGGENWSLPEGREADLLFGLVKAPNKTYRFTAQELVEDIERYHIHEVSEEPIRGLNIYLNVQMSGLQKTLIQWFESYTQREWLLLTYIHPRLIQEVQGQKELAYVFKLNNISAMDEIIKEFSGIMVFPEIDVSEENSTTLERYYKTMLPIYPQKLTLFSLKDIRTLGRAVEANASRFWNILRLMTYAGEYYGRNKGTIRVLLIGDGEAVALARCLLTTFNVTLARIDRNHNLSRFHGFDSFDVIVLTFDGYSKIELTQNACERLRNFVWSGGGLVVMFRWNECIDDIMGFRILDEKIPAGSIYEADLKNPILSPSTVINRYTCNWSGNKIVQISQNATFIVRDTNGQPWISSNPYGFGRGVLCGAPSSDFRMLEYDYLKLLTNVVFYAAKREYALPVLWYGDLMGGGSLEDLEYSITGKPGGPLLLWINVDNLERKFEMSLNASFFNIDPKGWIVLDAISWSPIGRGNGSEIRIEFETHSRIWSPAYIVNDTKEATILYSNSKVVSQKVYPNQALYELNALAWQDVLLIIKSATMPRDVFLNGFYIKRAETLSSITVDLNDSIYFYDQETGLLYIKIKSQEKNLMIRTIFEESKPLLQIILENKQLVLITIILSFLLIELMIHLLGKSKKA